MALREYLYPSLELKLVIVRSLDVDISLMKYGSESKEYEKAASWISLCPRDANRLGLKEGNAVQITSANGKVVVNIRVEEELSEGLAVMATGPWANALLPSKPPHQGITITLKTTKEPVTSPDELP
ncbi:MAG: molybdopterin dinucleotide binding domain-containing protein [Promethearchaeota archaeon]